MRIALIIERMDVWRGGRETSTAQLAAHLAGRGHEVTVVCQQGSLRQEAVAVRALGRRGVLRASQAGAFVSAAAEATRTGFDVVHAMLPVPGADVYQPRGGTIPGQAAAARRRWGLLWPVRAAAEPLDLKRRRLGRLERQVAADPAAVCLCVSAMVRREFRRHYGREDGVRVAFNGVDVPDPDGPQRADWRQQIRFRLGVGRHDPVFLTVATNFGLKGVTETIRAFARWVHSPRGVRGARLIVVGRELVEAYRRLAGLHDVGRWVDFVPRTDDVFRWYAAADACVLLSWYDPCSRVILEATRWGIPSITTSYNGAAEVLGEGAGIVVRSPRQVRRVAEAMAELADPQARAARAAACRQVADGLTMARHVDEVLKAYEGARRRGGGRSMDCP
jgi:UDP-glucose:(heptosyl)LPS alpha-1,3-glucosyltransferase